MQAFRNFTRGAAPLDGLNFVSRSSEVFSRGDKKTVRIVAPECYGQVAVDMLAQKYARRAGVPDEVRPVPEDGVPQRLWRSEPVENARFGREEDCRQIWHRLAGAWAYHGWKGGYFDGEDDALGFYEESLYMLAHQVAAPNSPQYFNVGLWWAYGITGEPSGYWCFDPDGKVYESPDTYSRPAAGACFLQSLNDSLVDEGGITSLVEREARVFKGGGGSGVNVSNLRGENEPLSGGGKSSGLLSFLKTFDSSAGAIKSGGTLRRAACMRIADVDHPDIESFIGLKVREEQKVAAMVAGSRLIDRHLRDIAGSVSRGDQGILPALAKKAKRDGVPKTYIDLALAGKLPEGGFPVFDAEFEGEAYQTVTGQNANNSVRVTNEFMRAVQSGGDHRLYWRTEKKKAALEGREPTPCKTMKSEDLWGKIIYSAWSCADPGVQFDTTINEWNTCPEDGRINTSNPCSEIHFLDNISCNLASLNLMKFYDVATGSYDCERLSHASKVWTTVLDITVGMSQYPSRESAEATWKYRTIGLGYCNLGALLMAMGMPYDSNDARLVAAAISGIVHFSASIASSEMASRIGTFPRFDANRRHCLRVATNHAAAATHRFAYDGLDIFPQDHVRNHVGHLDPTHPANVLVDYARLLAVESVEAVEANGSRNAQLGAIAPTGTISLVMEADTTGAEPDFALVKHKKLAGGGYVQLVNQTVRVALVRLGYSADKVGRIVRHVGQHGNVAGCPELLPQHAAVFDCATGARAIRPEAHVLMVAAIQAFVAGAVSKTINAPESWTEAELSSALTLAWRSGCKAIAVYRDNSKMSQVLSGTSEESEKVDAEQAAEFNRQAAREGDFAVPFSEADTVVDAPAPARHALGERRLLPDRRAGYTQKARIASHKVYLRTGQYPDGTLGEIFITMHKEGAMLRAVVDSLAIAVSLGLQHGVPLEEYVEAFTFTKFEPNGAVQGNARIKSCTSLVDYIFRELAVTYLGRDDLAHAPPATPDSSATDEGNPDSTANALAPRTSPPIATHRHPPVPSPSEVWGRVLQHANSQAAEAVSRGFTGDACADCGGFSMVRSGTCCRCVDCGGSSGCS